MVPAVRRACLVLVVLCSAFQAVYLRAATLPPRVGPPPSPPESSPLPSPPRTPGGARLEAAPASHDFGRVTKLQSVKTRFVVTNRGQGPGQVARVFSTCGCTASNLGKSWLEPGEATELEVVFTGKDPGPFHKVVFIVMAHPDPSLRVGVTGTVSQ